MDVSPQCDGPRYRPGSLDLCHEAHEPREIKGALSAQAAVAGNARFGQLRCLLDDITRMFACNPPSLATYLEQRSSRPPNRLASLRALHLLKEKMMRQAKCSNYGNRARWPQDIMILQSTIDRESWEPLGPSGAKSAIKYSTEGREGRQQKRKKHPENKQYICLGVERKTSAPVARSSGARKKEDKRKQRPRDRVILLLVLTRGTCMLSYSRHLS
ncbi:hypothetical protein MGYG_00487 [Nannizzia gypsea CBS 118893]|uniref:Uncharacterized protein n=1 Tax=Arthroderma gypseum (strain ATCC MYA-4604 / CBS 118893) TaxID=535722 RepID=E5R035_ARTGP|nr:hypothetical protein MGYG_00487 [Nannizzia gypsea CBS 118893]EFQ97446.1 hypothetical protein MGYG_00487 [Nannizzia gypsea CBS 118893]